MAVAYLNDGATSLAAANWSDTTGFADNAELQIGEGSQSILSDLDFSTIAGGNEAIDLFRVSSQFRGIIGALNTPLKVDCDGTIDYRGAGAFYYDAEGDDNICAEFIHAGTGYAAIVGGTITSLTVQSGTFLLDSNTILTTAYLTGGRGEIQDHASSTITNCWITGGSWTIKRPGVYHVGGTANVTIDIDGGTVTYNQHGGKAVLKRGTLANFNGYGGSLDASRVERVETLGGSSGVVLPSYSITKDDTVTISATYVGSVMRYDGGMVPSGG